MPMSHDGDDRAKRQLCIVLSVFRGSIVRKASSPQLGEGGVSKPLCHDLPAGCVRMVHVAPFCFEMDHWVTSCPPVLLLINLVNCARAALERAM